MTAGDGEREKEKEKEREREEKEKEREERAKENEREERERELREKMHEQEVLLKDQESALLRLERENEEYEELVAQLENKISELHTALSLSSSEGGLLLNKTESTGTPAVGHSKYAEEGRTRQDGGGNLERGGAGRESSPLSLSRSLQNSLSFLERAALIEQKNWELEDVVESSLSREDEREGLTSARDMHPAAFEEERARHRDVVRRCEALLVDATEAREREMAAVKHNVVLQKQVEELESDLMTCLESEADKQREIEWLTCSLDEKNTHLDFGQERIDVERQRFVEQLDQERVLLAEQHRLSMEALEQAESLRGRLEERDVEVATIAHEREGQELLIASLGAEVVCLEQMREELLKEQSAEVSHTYKCMKFTACVYAYTYI